MLNPINTWKDNDEYKKIAEGLAIQFSKAFDKAYGRNDIAPDVKKNCPGK
jgi:ATP-dependent phosphoenolpyruvate carboxykinase